MTGRRTFAFVAKQSKNKHSNRLMQEGQVWMRWGERNSVLEKSNREVGGRGWKEAGGIIWLVVSYNRVK